MLREKEDNAPDGDWNGATFVVVLLYLLHLFPQCDKVTTEHLLGFGRKTRGAFPALSLAAPKRMSPKNVRFAIGNVPFHLVNVDFSNYFTVLTASLIRPVHVDVHNMLRDHLSKLVRQPCIVVHSKTD